MLAPIDLAQTLAAAAGLVTAIGVAVRQVREARQTRRARRQSRKALEKVARAAAASSPAVAETVDELERTGVFEAPDALSGDELADELGRRSKRPRGA